LESLRRLSDIRGDDRCVLTVYFPGTAEGGAERPMSLVDLPAKLLLETTLTVDEAEHRLRCLKLWEEVVPRIDPSLAPAWMGVVSWMTEDAAFMRLPAATSPAVYLDNSPFLLPAGQLLDDLEIYAVVYADHRRASIYTAAFGELHNEASVRGAIKNHVRKGGWSQQRYERRRDKQIHYYCQDIIGKLKVLVAEEALRRIVLAGDSVLLRELEKGMSPALQKLVVNRLPMEDKKGDDEVFRETLSAAAQEEKAEERRLLHAIRSEAGAGGRAVVGPADTLRALKERRVRHLLVGAMTDVPFHRCGRCGWFGIAAESACAACGAETYQQSAANEFSDLAFEGGSLVEFTTDSLQDIRGVGALTRW